MEYYYYPIIAFLILNYYSFIQDKISFYTYIALSIICLYMFMILLYPNEIVVDSNGNAIGINNKIRVYIDERKFMQSQLNAINKELNDKHNYIGFLNELLKASAQEYNQIKNNSLSTKADKLRGVADWIDTKEFYFRESLKVNKEIFKLKILKSKLINNS